MALYLYNPVFVWADLSCTCNFRRFSVQQQHEQPSVLPLPGETFSPGVEDAYDISFLESCVEEMGRAKWRGVLGEDWSEVLLEHDALGPGSEPIDKTHHK
jgi:hypothetical protein